MRLSMWIINDWLKKYDPEARINEGEQVLRSARILSNDISIERQNVYLARAEEFINGEADKIICVHGQDLILLNTSDMNEVLNDIFDAFDFYNSWADGISEAIGLGCSAQEIVDASHVVFHQPIIIYNSLNEIISASSAYPAGSLDREWDNILENKTNTVEFIHKINELLKQQRKIHELRHFHLPMTPYGSVYKSLFQEKEWIGRMILLENDHSLTKGEEQLFISLASMVEHWSTVNGKTSQLREETAIFRDLLENKGVTREEIDHKLRMAGWERDQKKQLFRIEIPQAESEISRVLYIRLENNYPDAYIIYYPNVVFVLVNLELTPAYADPERMRDILEQSGLCALASYEFTDILHLADHNEQCILAYTHVPKKKGMVYSCADYALPCIRSSMSAGIPAVLRHPALGLLEQYDGENKGELYHTLYVYLRCSCNVAEAARQLHLHRNSMIYRLNQIREITGSDMSEADEREHLLLSYYF